MKSNLIPFDQIKEPLRLPEQTNLFRTSSSTPPPPTSGINRSRRILPVIQGTYADIERAENYLPLQPFFNNTHFGQTVINCIHNQHRIGIPDEYFVETCVNTYTQNGFVTKLFVKSDEDSQTQDYTIIYIRFQGQTPPFSTHNRDIFERLLPTPFPQVGDILTEEEDSESKQELIASHNLEQGPNPNSKPCLPSSLQPQLPSSQLSIMKNLQNKILSTIFSTRS